MTHQTWITVDPERHPIGQHARRGPKSHVLLLLDVVVQRRRNASPTKWTTNKHRRDVLRAGFNLSVRDLARAKHHVIVEKTQCITVSSPHCVLDAVLIGDHTRLFHSRIAFTQRSNRVSLGPST
mgnify:CR=1 FL=1